MPMLSPDRFKTEASAQTHKNNKDTVRLSKPGNILLERDNALGSQIQDEETAIASEAVVGSR